MNFVSDSKTSPIRWIGGKEIRCDFLESPAGVRVTISPSDAPLLAENYWIKITSEEPLPVRDNPVTQALVVGALAWADLVHRSLTSEQQPNAEVMYSGTHVILQANTHIDRFISLLEFLPAVLESAFSMKRRAKHGQQSAQTAAAQRPSTRPIEPMTAASASHRAPASGEAMAGPSKRKGAGTG